MNGTEKQDEFTYWKRSWHKWLILAVAIIQLLCLWMNIQEYNRIFTVGILSTSEWADYAASKNWQCAINGVMAGCFLGTFLIGIFAKSQRTARLAEGVLLLFLFFVCGTIGFTLHLFSLSGKGLVWILILLIAFGGAIHNFWQYRKE